MTNDRAEGRVTETASRVSRSQHHVQKLAIDPSDNECNDLLNVSLDASPCCLLIFPDLTANLQLASQAAEGQPQVLRLRCAEVLSLQAGRLNPTRGGRKACFLKCM